MARGRKRGSIARNLEVKKIIFVTAWKARLNKGKRGERLRVKNDIKSQIKKKGYVLPADDVLLREISRIWNHASDPLDRPWSLISLPDNPIASEALPYVLKVWARSMTSEVPRPASEIEYERKKKGITEEIEKFVGPKPEETVLNIKKGDFTIEDRDGNVLQRYSRAQPLTIREALWVGRLYSLFRTKALGSLGELNKDGKSQTQLTLPTFQYQVKLNHIRISLPTDLDDVDTLWAFASTLAINEKFLNREGSYPDTREGILSYWLNDAEIYGTLPEGEPSAVNLQRRLTQEFMFLYVKGRRKKGRG